MKKALWFSVAMGVLGVAASLVMWGHIPSQMPIHWGINGKPDNFMAKEIGLWLFPGLIAVLPMIIFAMLKLDPREENVESSKKPIAWLLGGLSVFLLAIHVLTLYASTQKGMELSGTWVLAMVGALFAGIGVLLPQMKSNWFVGIRTPWTLSSEQVWEKTHRVGGRWMVGAGLAVLIAALLLPQAIGTIVSIVLLVLGGLVPVALSFLYYRQEQRSH